MRKSALFAFLLLHLLNPLPKVLAADLETPDLIEVLPILSEKIDAFGRNRVLVVFDIDNTLLVNNQELGTDQWFAWQSKLVKSGDFEKAVASSYTNLIEVQSKIYTLSGTHPTQPDAASILEVIQNQGVPTIALTARSTESRDATERELRRNHLSFRDSGIGEGHGIAGTYFPYTIQNPEQSGILPRELERWNLGDAREVSYVNGIMMVAGQHKGAMLRTLLHHFNLQFDAILFVDDKDSTSETLVGANQVLAAAKSLSELASRLEDLVKKIEI